MIKISVIIPTWKRAYELNEVCKGLCLQTFKASEFEVIICDSKSNDQTQKIVDSYKEKININIIFILYIMFHKILYKFLIMYLMNILIQVIEI